MVKYTVSYCNLSWTQRCCLWPLWWLLLLNPGPTYVLVSSLSALTNNAPNIPSLTFVWTDSCCEIKSQIFIKLSLHIEFSISRLSNKAQRWPVLRDELCNKLHRPYGREFPCCLNIFYIDAYLNSGLCSGCLWLLVSDHQTENYWSLQVLLLFVF